MLLLFQALEKTLRRIQTLSSDPTLTTYSVLLTTPISHTLTFCPKGQSSHSVPWLPKLPTAVSHPCNLSQVFVVVPQGSTGERWYPELIYYLLLKNDNELFQFDSNLPYIHKAAIVQVLCQVLYRQLHYAREFTLIISFNTQKSRHNYSCSQGGNSDSERFADLLSVTRTSALHNATGHHSHGSPCRQYSLDLCSGTQCKRNGTLELCKAVVLVLTQQSQDL